MIIWLDNVSPPVRNRKISSCIYSYEWFTSINEAEDAIISIDNLSCYDEYCGDLVQGVDIGDKTDIMEFLRWLKEDGRKYDIPRLGYHGEDPVIRQQIQEIVKNQYRKELKFDD